MSDNNHRYCAATSCRWWSVFTAIVVLMAALSALPVGTLAASATSLVAAGATTGSTGVAVQTINPGPVASFGELTPAVFSSLPPTTIMQTAPTQSAVFPYSGPRGFGWGNVCSDDR